MVLLIELRDTVFNLFIHLRRVRYGHFVFSQKTLLKLLLIPKRLFDSNSFRYARQLLGVI